MRDLMLKYNLIKASKAIIDIGTNSSKMLEADYTPKLILIGDAHFLKIKYNGEKSFEELASGRTTVVIAHRLSTLRNMDRIIVLDKGHIIESGSHTKLLRQKGLYSRLWQMQSGGFIQ